MIEVKDLEDKLNKDGFVVSEIKGVSMHPLLKQGRDRVIISKVNRPINKYDVVLYKANNNYVLHRIIDINGDNLLIRGDNCINSENVNIKDVLGILVSFYRENEYIEINNEMNYRCYKTSSNSLLFRRIKYKILRVIKNSIIDE